MVVLNYARNRAALLFGGSIVEAIDYLMIGTGSETIDVTQDSLTTPVDRQLTTALTYPTLQKIKSQGDWNSVEMSGIQLSEFGVTTSGVGVTGSMWSKSVIPSLTFDGTNELRIEETIEFF